MSYYQGDYYMAGQSLPRTGSSGGGVNWGAIARGVIDVGSAVLPGVLGNVAQAGARKGMPGLYGTPGLSAFAGGGAMPGLAAALGGAAGVRRRYRRMNVTNVRALRRSMRRVTGFARLARSTIGFTQRVKMKKRRRR